MTQSPASAPLDDDTPQPRASLLPPGMKRSLSSILGPLIGLLVVMLIFGAWKPTRFLTAGNFNNVLIYNYHDAVTAVGMTFVIVTAGIDLSVGSMMALASMCCAIAIRGVEFPPREAGMTIGRLLSVCGAIGVITSASAAGCTIGPPAARL